MKDLQTDGDGEVRLQDVRNYLRYSADAVRNRGHTHEHSIKLIADYYGLAARRVRCLVFGQSIKLLDSEMKHIAARFEDHLVDEGNYLRARIELMQDRLARLRAGGRIDYQREPGTEHMTRRTPVKHGPRQKDSTKLPRELMRGSGPA